MLSDKIISHPKLTNLLRDGRDYAWRKVENDTHFTSFFS